ncbi:MAG: hypothetical protein ABI672_05335 [Vicinamibacteria bacterium]
MTQITRTDDSHRARTKLAVGASALFMAALGLALLFAGPEVMSAVFASPVPEPFPAILGAAFLGFASMNWIARHNILGGIYGRAVIAANQTHLTIGAIVLVKHGLSHGGSTGFWILAGFYVLAAVLFTVLLRGPGRSQA